MPSAIFKRLHPLGSKTVVEAECEGLELKLGIPPTRGLRVDMVEKGNIEPIDARSWRSSKSRVVSLSLMLGAWDRVGGAGRLTPGC